MDDSTLRVVAAWAVIAVGFVGLAVGFRAAEGAVNYRALGAYVAAVGFAAVAGALPTRLPAD